MNTNSTTIQVASPAYREAKSSAVWSPARNFGVLKFAGTDCLDLLNRLSTNQLNNLAAGQGRQTVLTNEKGRVIDVLTILVFDNKLLVLTSHGKEREVMQWVRKYVVMDDVKIADITSEYRFLEILGPAAPTVFQRLTGISVLDLKMSHWLDAEIGNTSTVAFRVPPVSESSYIFAMPNGSDAREIISETGLTELSGEDFNFLRVEAGIPRAGNELTADYNALEAGLLHLIDFKKGCYIGQEVIARLDSYNKVQKRVMGFRAGATIVEGNSIISDGKEVGLITSATVTPDFGHIALGYIRGEFATPGATVSLSNGGLATISNLPFTEV